jgi:hypothetical protein
MTTVTLDLDEALVADLRAEAERTGRTVDEVAARRLRASVIDELWSRNDLDEDAAMALADEAVRAVRADRTPGARTA